MSIAKLTAKKVPALALLLVAVVGAVAGVLAASIIVTPKPYTGEIGTFHTNSGAVTVTDNGLGVVANTNATPATSASWPGPAQVNTALTAGNWFEKLSFTTSLATAGSHTATVTVNTGSGPEGTGITGSPFTFTLTTIAGTNSGTITAYIDTGATTLNSPVTVYVNIN